MDHSQGFTLEECKRIIEGRTGAKHSSNLFTNDDIDYYYYILKDRWILERIANLFKGDYPDNTIADMEEIYLHEYFPNCRFRRHSDKVLYPDHLLNIGVALNDDYEGGEFMLYDPDYTVPKQAGLLYSYDSGREHEVLLLKEGKRYSLNLFLKHKHLYKSFGLI